MSYEGRVMPAEAALDAARKEVTPASGEEALGKWRALDSRRCLDSEPGIDAASTDAELEV
ncbi:hypothetical protein ACFL59_13070 [Planctomycetota bacterium]